MNEGDAPEADDMLMARLSNAVSQDGPPAAVVAAAKAAFTWRTIDAELAELTFDSTDQRELAGVRGAAGPRTLTFEVGDHVIELEVEDTGATRRLEGQVLPPGVDQLQLHSTNRAEPLTLTTDDLGRFHADGVAPGRLRLFCRFQAESGGGALLTEWMQV